MKNELLLSNTFREPQSILPLQNLGELALIMQKQKDAFSLFDMSIKLYKHLDKDNMLKFKVLTLLASMIEQAQPDAEGVKRVMIIHDQIFKAMKDVECYEKVFATRNYGYLLAKHDQHKLEGRDLIDQADEMQKKYPYWSERQMGLFVPKMVAIDDN